MLHFFSIFSALCFMVVPAMAQEKDELSSEKAFQFVYIAQDHSMNVQALLDKLRDDYNHAIMDGPTIFYFSRGTSPLIVKVNFPDDNRVEFEETLLPKVTEQESPSVDGNIDKKQIIALLRDNNFVYRRTDFKFYVGQSFWTMGNNEAVIASLYFVLDIINYIGDETFNLNVYCPRNIELGNNTPFGVVNPDGINDEIRLSKIL